jgi:glyoxylase-like metal-dependent hydrolase (beta-lactamase superfamily II)
MHQKQSFEKMFFVGILMTMRIQSINQVNVSACQIHHLDTDPFNWYLLVEGGRITLVDAGFPRHYSVFQRGIEALGFSERDVEAIVLTHAHADHVGFAERVRKMAKVPVFVHREDVAMARKPLQLPWLGLVSNAWRPYMASVLGNATLNGVFALSHLSEVHAIEDGQLLDIPGRPRVIHTPGHTRGAVALFLEESKVLLSGDTLVTRNLLTGKDGLPQLTNDVLNHDLGDAKRSLLRLKELGDVMMLPGHGRSWTGNMAVAVEMAKREILP